MSSLTGGGSNARQQQVAGSLKFQTSQAGSVIPLVYGCAKIAPNLLDYQDFTAFPAKNSGKGKGTGLTGKGSGQTDYSASIILGLCQGPIRDFGMCWFNRSVAPLSGIDGLSYTALGTDGQTPDPYWLTFHMANALGYSGTAYFTLDNYQLGASASLPNFNIEIEGLEAGTAANQTDANPAAIVTDFLTNPRYGAGFPSSALGDLTTYHDYCDASGIFLSPTVESQAPAQNLLSELMKITNSAVVWSGGVLKIIPYGDEALSVAYTAITIGGLFGELDTVSITLSGAGLGSPVTVSYQVQPVAVSADTVYPASVMLGLASAVNSGPGLNAAKIYAGVLPSGVLIADRSGTGTLVIECTATGAETVTIGTPTIYSWQPELRALYALDDDDFITQASMVGASIGVTPGSPALRQGASPVTGGFMDDPVHISPTSPADADNYYIVECTERGMSYNPWPVIAFDQATIDQYGLRQQGSIKARAVVDSQFVGPTVARLVMQRGLYFRRSFSFSLGWNYCLIEPMDLVQITDPRLGAQALTVRITSVAEDAEGTLAFTAEDFFGTPLPGVLYPKLTPPPQPMLPQPVSSLGQGLGTATFSPSQAPGATRSTPVYNAAAPPVATPFILEATPALLTAQGIASPTLIVGLCGGINGYSSSWGGAQVYVSTDNASYGLQGDFVGVSTMGVTTAELGPAGDSLAVDLSGCHGSLQSVSIANAAAGISLCALRYPSGQIEFLSFTTATLTGPFQYTLTQLYRGLYGTFAIDQPAGAQFLFLGDGHYYSQVLPPKFLNVPLWFKFPSNNPVGGGAQSLADALAYAFTSTGGQIVIPPSFGVRADVPAAVEVRSTTVRRAVRLPVESR